MNSGNDLMRQLWNRWLFWVGLHRSHKDEECPDPEYGWDMIDRSWSIPYCYHDSGENRLRRAGVNV